MVNIPIKNKSFELGYGQSLSEDLGITPKSLQPLSMNGLYTISFSVQNSFPSYPGLYEVELSFGTQKLCDAYGWGTSTIVLVNIGCPSPAYLIYDKSLPGGGSVQGDSNLFIKWTVNDGSFNGGWPVKFTNASLTFTPTN